MPADHPKTRPARSWLRPPFHVALLLCWMVGGGDNSANTVLASEGGPAVDEIGSSNLQVRLDGVWRGVCCDGRTLAVGEEDCWWTEHDRTLTDETHGLKADCPEGGPTHCECNDSGERLHGIDGGHLDASIQLPDGGPIYSDYHLETCVVVDDDGELETAWTSASCPAFRLR